MFGVNTALMLKTYKCVGWEVEANFGRTDSMPSAQKWEQVQETTKLKTNTEDVWNDGDSW